MRKSTGVAAFLALGMGTVAVGASIANDGKMKGTDLFRTVVIEVITACGADVAGIIYDGGGSSNGQNEMGLNNQQIAPMSRKVNSSLSNGCGNPGIAATAEGIVIGLEGIALVAAASVASTCSANPVAGEDCDAATDAVTGLAYSRTFDTALDCASAGLPDEAKCDAVDVLYDCNPSTLKCSYTLGGGFAGTANDWKDVLRLIYGGLDANDGNTFANRDCDSPARVALANNWGNIFESSCSTGCTLLQHAFRRDDETSATDTFVSALDLPGIAINNGLAECNNTISVGAGCVGRTPFCNALWADQDDVRAQACSQDKDCFGFDCNESSGFCRTPRRPYYSDMQDNDRIRRPCVGTGNLSGPPGTLGGEPPAEPTEQVCNRDGTLGLVLAIQPPPASITSAVYPMKHCARGRFFNGATSTVAAGPPTVRDRCPNGDVTFLGGCLIPMSLDNDTACISGKNNLPTFKLDPSNAIATDGRVYNRYLRKGGTGADKGALPAVVRNTKSSDVVGAFYKLHGKRSLAPAPSFKNVCNSESDAGNQIACLTIASQCSVGFSRNSAAAFVLNNDDLNRSFCNSSADCGSGGTCANKCFGSMAACAGDGDCTAPPDVPSSLANCGVCEYPAEAAAGLELAALEPSDACVRKRLPGGVGIPYPISRSLYLISLDGFETLPDQSLFAPKSELALAQCFSNDSIVHPIARGAGMITIGDVSAQPAGCSNAASLFCDPQCGSDTCGDNGEAGVTTRTAPVDLSPGHLPDDSNACP